MKLELSKENQPTLLDWYISLIRGEIPDTHVWAVTVSFPPQVFFVRRQTAGDWDSVQASEWYSESLQLSTSSPFLSIPQKKSHF